MRENRKERNIAVFEDTMAWIRQDGTLQDAVEETKKRTVFYPASGLPEGGASAAKKRSVPLPRNGTRGRRWR